MVHSARGLRMGAHAIDALDVKLALSCISAVSLSQRRKRSSRSGVGIVCYFYLRIQMLTHPIGLLRSMFVWYVVADVIAVLKHPQFCPAACLRRDALTLFRWHEPIAAALNDQQGACNLLRHSLQVELLQFVH